MYNFANAKQSYPREPIPPHKRQSKARHCDDRHRETPPPSGRTAIALHTSKYDIISNGLCSPTYMYGSGNKKPNFRSQQCLMAGPESAVEAYSDFFFTPTPPKYSAHNRLKAPSYSPPRRKTNINIRPCKKRQKRLSHVPGKRAQPINLRYLAISRRNIVTLHYI